MKGSGYIIVLAILAGIGLIYLGLLSSNCDEKHGVLVRGAVGFPVCIEQGKH